MNPADYKNFSEKYQIEDKEILVLINDKSGGAVKNGDSWEASQSFLAYFDLDTGELKNGDGRMTWLLSEEQLKEFGATYPYKFEKGTIYKMKVRELLDKTVPTGRVPSFYNRFMIVDLQVQNVQDEELQAVLEVYRKPVTIEDELGYFELNKDYGSFLGTIDWLGNEVSATLDVDSADEKTWTYALENLRELCENKQELDLRFRTFGAEKLTDLANDWAEDDIEITQEYFVTRMTLSELVVNFEGHYSAYYDDGDLFYGHVINISGHLKNGMDSANIAG